MHRLICLTMILFTFYTANATTQNSSQQELTPKEYKRIPPFPPVGLTAVYTHKGVKLSWQRHALESIISYEVYRSRGQKRPIRLITTKNLSFFDKKGRCNNAYTIKAVRYDGTKSSDSSKITAVCKK